MTVRSFKVENDGATQHLYCGAMGWACDNTPRTAPQFGKTLGETVLFFGLPHTYSTGAAGGLRLSGKVCRGYCTAIALPFDMSQ